MKKILSKLLLSFLVFMMSGYILVAQKTVTGTVTDIKGGEIPGANVSVKGTSKGTITDLSGMYSIDGINTGDVLVFSFVGMETKEIEVGDQTVIDAVLTESSEQIDEVVVIGYGEKQKKDITTSISTVRSDQIEKMSGVSPELSLQGTPGIRLESGGGSSFSRSTINIRGVNTWGSSQPLIVIDGVPVTEFGSGAEGSDARNSDLRSPVNVLSMINPKDIASISVLKDASAGAIYGIRAANGVILIETKKGKEGKMNVEFSTRMGLKKLTKTYDMLDISDYVSLYQEAYTNAGSPIPQEFDASNPAYLGGRSNVDWQTPFLNDKAKSTEYNLRIMGGTKKTNYFISSGYMKDDAPTINDNMERYSITSNVNTQATKWFRAGMNIRGIYQTNNATAYGDGFSGNNLESFASAPAWQPIYGSESEGTMGPNGYARTTVDGTRDGSDFSQLWGPATITNGFGIMSVDQTDYDLQRVLGSLYAEIEPVKDLRIKARLGGDYYTNRRSMWNDVDRNFFLSTAASPLSLAIPGEDDSEGFYEQRITKNYNLNKELIVNYHKTFVDLHDLALTFTATSQEYGFEAIATGSQQMKYSDPKYRVVQAIDQQYINGYTDKWNSSLIGYMGRASYNFAHKYYFDAVVRYDASSKFAKDYNTDIFPGFSAAWRVSDESFMNNASWLNDLKLRAGWGEVGNDEISNFAFMTLMNEQYTYAFGTNGVQGYGYVNWGSASSRMGNEALTWEKTATTNIAVDLVAFNNFNVTLEFFNKKSQDLLSSIEIAPSLGYTENPAANFGTVINKGIDFDLGYHGKIGNDFTYHIAGNISFVKNEVTELFDDAPWGSDQFRVEEGRPLGFIWGYKTDGILQTAADVTNYQNAVTDPAVVAATLAPGDYRFQDIHGNPDGTDENRFYSPDPDGVINEYDKVYLGKNTPSYTYGLNLSFAYKFVDLSAVFYGEGDVQRYNDIRASQEDMASTGANQSTTVLNRWTASSPSTEMPRAINGDPSSNNRFSDRFVEDADYFRLLNLQIGFTLPGKAYDMIGFGEKLRVWLGGSNLFTITKYSGLDPSVPNWVMPTPRVISFGLDIKF